MTRLTNAFSKKWENLRAAYALWFAFFNFCRIQKTREQPLLWKRELLITYGICENS
jgi:hypothetical protein